MQHIEFNKLRNTSLLFTDFLSSSENIGERFPGNSKLNDLSYLKHLAYGFSARPAAEKVIIQSMRNLDKSSRQNANIELAPKPNTLFVSTGQQAGFLGGPLYTSFKIATAVSKAKKLSELYPDLNFIPLFWLEDNDHDSREAGQVYVFDNRQEPHLVSAYGDEPKMTPVSELAFSEDIEDRIDQIIDLLPYSDYKDETALLLKSIYKEKQSWGDATIQLYQTLFKGTGLLFAKASVCREEGLFADLVRNNLESEESIARLNEVISTSNEKMRQAGYDINYEVEKISYCLHEGGNRNVIRFQEETGFSAGESNFSLGDLQILAQQQPEKFSPKVLLRPIAQDSIFPIALSILGPGEISYYSILKEVYDYFGVPMPAVEMRLSATFLLPKQKEFFKDNDLDIVNFLKDTDEIESDLSRLMIDEETENEFDWAENVIEKTYMDLKPIVNEVDFSLDRAVEASLHKSLDLLVILKKKYLSQKKKKNTEYIQKYRKMKNFIYLHNKLQERNFSPVNFINFYGLKNFANILLELADNESKEHIIF